MYLIRSALLRFLGPLVDHLELPVEADVAGLGVTRRPLEDDVAGVAADLDMERAPGAGRSREAGAPAAPMGLGLAV
jgi:hypothetical protein